RAYCLKTQPATGETYPKSDLFNKAPPVPFAFIGLQTGPNARTDIPHPPCVRLDLLPAASGKGNISPARESFEVR
ncbi:hypothetical protein, partial [Klebsiella quasipneumoniae]|uniref:hypothetical protein n=1 Tax=Klebsiella quasipneumoniae TaxID=1463165 RepID=UPI003004419C